MADSLNTIDTELRLARDRLEHAGIESPSLEARVLMQTTTGLSTTELIVRGNEYLSAEHWQRFETLVAKRCQGVPLAHVTGDIQFHDLHLKSDHRALVPRQDTTALVELALGRVPSDQPIKVADLGTGSGCVLLSLLAARQTWHGVGLDVSEDAIALATENCALIGLERRATFLTQSWSTWMGWTELDLVVSNPPYIPRDEITTLDREVRDHDPHLALDGGPDGLDAYREIIRLAGQNLRPNSWLVFEIGWNQADDVRALMAQAGFSHFELRTDLAGHHRAIAAQWAVHK